MVQKLAHYIDTLNAASKERGAYYQFSVTEGRRYYKVVQKSQSLQDENTYEWPTVHSFVDKETLDVYKPASWQAPAKGVRFNLNKDLEKLQKIADPYGSYLYAWR